MASWIQSTFGSKVSPVILFVIVLLAAGFFIAALLYLLIRFLLKQRSAGSNHDPEHAVSGPLQRQLQHLFNLHDSGLDQAYIDALPVFIYKDIVGKKEPFDCAVCLSEFSEQDGLRLLPLCSHAFHIHCIDTWLLSNSTCPLCRGVILTNVFESPVFSFDDLKDFEGGSSRSYTGVCENASMKVPVEIDNNNGSAVINGKRVFSVRLGKFRSTRYNNDNDDDDDDDNKNNCVGSEGRESGEVGESSGNSNLDGRRCYSMGSFQYVVADSELQVALCPSRGVEGSVDVKNLKRNWGQNGNFTFDMDGVISDGKRINRGSKGESYSVSKIWLWSKKGKFPGSTGTHYSNTTSDEAFP